MALEEFRAEAERCSQCSYCKWVAFDHLKSWRFGLGCPSIANNHFLSYAARGRYSLTLALLEGRVKYDKNDKRLQDIAFKCQACGSCDVTCKICRFNLEPLDMIRELRAHLVADGQGLPQHIPFIEGLRKTNNILLKPKTERGAWAKGLTVKNLSQEKAKVAFFAGCRFSYDEALQKTARTALTLLAGSGIDIGIMGKEEACCGSRAYDMGYRDDFSRCAKQNAEAWQKAGVKTIVTSCSDCYHAFKRLYPKIGYQFEVLHTVEYLDRLIKEGKLKPTKKIPLKITYHDPCHLGRQGEPYIPWQGKEKKLQNQIVVYEPRRPRNNGALGIYDPPRNVLKSIPGLELVEMERIREYAWCCGAGGGVKEGFPEYSDWTAGERIEEARATGAEAIVSACGWCERNFTDAIAADGETMKVFDVAELLQQAL